MTIYSFMMLHKDGRIEKVTREFPGGHVGHAVTDAKQTAKANKAKLLRDDIGAIVTFSDGPTVELVKTVEAIDE